MQDINPILNLYEISQSVILNFHFLTIEALSRQATSKKNNPLINILNVQSTVKKCFVNKLLGIVFGHFVDDFLRTMTSK